MSKVTKNVVMVFTLFCVVMLIIFCVELFLLNRDRDDRPDVTISSNGENVPTNGEEMQNIDDLLQNIPPDETEPALDIPPDNDQPDGVITTTPPQGAHPHTVLLPPGTAELTFFVEIEYFEREELGDGNGWLFTYLQGEDAWLEVGFMLVPPQGGILEIAQTFLDNYLDDGDYSNFEGERAVANSTVRGLFVTGESEGVTYDAWLRDLADLGESTLALIFVTRHSTDEERDILYRILDTMSIQMLIEEDPEDYEEEES
jgi:hypothetical protein